VRDVQSSHDHRNIPIDQVGVSDLSYPITVLDREQGRQHTVARLTMSVNLPTTSRGRT
jgi:GTP cyclohydrolase I